jgi:hypothetical protein
MRIQCAQGTPARDRELPSACDPKEKQMRSRILLSVVAIFLAGLPAIAQEAKPAGEQPKSETVNMDKLSKKPISITGRVGMDGLTLVAEKDSKTYKVLNPEFLKENTGQRIKVSGRVSKDNTEILVSSVMVQQEEPVAAKRDDSAFRR